MKTDKFRWFLGTASLTGIVFLTASYVHPRGVVDPTRKGETPKKSVHSTVRTGTAKSPGKALLTKAYGQLPLSFEPNEGQAGSSVQYVAHGEGYTLLLTRNGAELALEGQDVTDRILKEMDPRARKKFEARKFYRMSPRFHRGDNKETVRMAIDGANPSASAVALDHLPGKANYFIGRDWKKWYTGIPTYRRIKYTNVYPGTDLIYYGKQGRLEFDFVLAPNADPKAIHLHFDTRERLAIDEYGDLTFARSARSFQLLHPIIYQVRHGIRIPIQGRFVLGTDNTVGIEVANYDHGSSLIVDPVLTYSTYLGGSGSDYASGIAVDYQGNAYIVGQTTSTDFPTYGYSSTGNANGVAFVSELDPTGTILLYSTYLGGTGGDWGSGVAVDSDGNVYVTGSTLSSDFPLVNAFQDSLSSENGNAFVACIDALNTGTASLAFSTYLGGGGNSSNFLGDVGLAIAADQSGLAYVTGQTASDSSVTSFPTTAGALQLSLVSVNGNAFLSVLDTVNGGAGALVYSTYLGGNSEGFGDYGLGVTVDTSGDAYITGQTTSGASGPFPTTSGAYQTTLNSQYGNAFVTEINTQQSGLLSLVYSTYLGGSSTIVVGDVGSGIGLDITGKIYVGGDTTSADFPVTAGAYQTTNSPAGKAFAASFDPTKTGSQSLVYSTFLGGTEGAEGEVINGLAVDVNGNALVAGSTSSSDFPTTTDAFQTELKNSSWDAFLTKMNPSGTGLVYSTYFGGSCANGDLGNGVALDLVGNPYVVGSTCSTDLSVAPTNAYQTALKGTYNVFVARFVWNPNPTITASLTPTANGSGWNNSPVTISFTCAPGPAPIQNCSQPVMVTTEGANQAESGTVTDSQGNTASTTATVNLDMTAPALLITNPLAGASVSTGTVAVTGTIMDALSGPGAVNCHGTPATLNGSSFSCNVQLSPGLNSITVIGSDLAGNTSSTTSSVTNTGASGQSNPPVISGISPNQGGVNSMVTLTGSSFGTAQGSSIVLFNGIPALVLSWSDSGISASVPAGLSPGTVNVNVAVGGSASTSVQFSLTQPLFITPSHITLQVGNTQPIQLVDENGVVITGASWSVNETSIAQVIPPTNGQPTLLQADAVGVATLTGSYGSRTATANVTVLAEGNPNGAILWSVPSTGPYGISKIVGATPGVGAAAFFAEDDGAYGGNGAIRAFDANGQQLLIWPASSASDAFPLLVAADGQGGALYFANQDNPNQFQSYCYFGRIDQTGNETWEYQESNCNEDTAVGPDGTIYLLEDDFQNSGTNVVTALDPATGEIKFSVPLPGFDRFTGGADYTMMPPPGDPNGVPQPYCTPGTSVPGGSPSTNAQPFEHGNMSVAADGTVYIPLTGGTYFFDGEPCDATPDPNNPGYTTVVNWVNVGSGTQGSFTDSRTLFLMAINPDGNYTTQTVDSQNLSGPGWFASPQYEVFMQRPVPNGQGSVLLPIEQTLYQTGGSGSNVLLPSPVPQGDDLVLGSDGTAYVREYDPNGSGYRNIVSAVNSGAITWTYQAPQGNLNISSVLGGGGVAVSNDELGLFLLDNSGNATATGIAASFVSLTSSWQDAWYALNVPGTNGGVSNVALSASVDDGGPWAELEGNPNSSHSQPLEEVLFLRSFARWANFGIDPDPGPPLPGTSVPTFCLSDCYAGDNRSFSTGLNDPNLYECAPNFKNTTTTTTSRITGVVRFLLPQLAIVGKGCAYSDPSYDWLGNTATDHPTIFVKPNSGGGFHIEIAGKNPLTVPQAFTPKIVTKLDITATLQASSGQVCFSGPLYGTAFPDSEVFVVNSQKQATMLKTWATTLGRNIGPFTLSKYALGGKDVPMGSFSNSCVGK